MGLRIYNTLTPDRRRIHAAGRRQGQACTSAGRRSTRTHTWATPWPPSSSTWCAATSIYRGYEVRYVTNFTDVDDKIIRRANETGQDPSSWPITMPQITCAIWTTSTCCPPTSTHASATRFPKSSAFIQELGEQGYAYELDGDVYFRVSKDDDYGKLSRRTPGGGDDAAHASKKTRARRHPGRLRAVEVRQTGRTRLGEPLGTGTARLAYRVLQPCACTHLGETIDIHGGGNDLIFPHHENEIAQSESLTGKPLARYWMHNGMLQLSGEKMSKSLGNLITIDEFLSQHSAGCAAHADLHRPLSQAGRLQRRDARTPPSAAWRACAADCAPARAQCTTGDDADALRIATEERTRRLHRGHGRRLQHQQRAGLDLRTGARHQHGTRGRRHRPLLRRGPAHAAGTDRRARPHAGRTRSPRWPAPPTAKPFVDLLVQVRSELRAAKQWALADVIRDGLAELDVTLEDTPDGTEWRFRDE